MSQNNGIIKYHMFCVSTLDLVIFNFCVQELDTILVISVELFWIDIGMFNIILDPENDIMFHFLGQETDRMCQFPGPETDVMGERYYIV